MTCILDLRSDDRDSILADLDEAHGNLTDVQVSVDSIRMQKYGLHVQYTCNIEMQTYRHAYTFIHFICLKIYSNAHV